MVNNKPKSKRPARKRRNRKPKQKKQGGGGKKKPRGAAMNFFLQAVANPCARGLSARIPDGNMFATSTAQIRWCRTFSSDGAGALAFLFNPTDVLMKPTGTAQCNLIDTFTLTTDTVTGTTNYSVATWNGLPQLDGLWSDVAEGRIVSGCVQAEFVGTTSADQGIIAAGLLPGDQIVGTTTAPDNSKYPVITTWSGFTALPTVAMGPLRQGIEAKYYPSTKQDLEFRSAQTIATGVTLSYLPTASTPPGLNTSPSKLVIWVTGAAASTAVLNVTFTANVEYIAKLGLAGGARGGGAQPGWIESAFKYVADLGNVVHPLTNYAMPMVGSMALAAGGNYIRQLSLGNA